MDSTQEIYYPRRRGREGWQWYVSCYLYWVQPILPRPLISLSVPDMQMSTGEEVEDEIDIEEKEEADDAVNIDPEVSDEPRARICLIKTAGTCQPSEPDSTPSSPPPPAAYPRLKIKLKLPTNSTPSFSASTSQPPSRRSPSRGQYFLFEFMMKMATKSSVYQIYIEIYTERLLMCFFMNRCWYRIRRWYKWRHPWFFWQWSSQRQG